jgi:putative sterol carrier protein
MPVLYPSDAWIKELQEICNADPEFRELSAHFSGNFIFRIEAEPGVLEKPVFLFCLPDRGEGKEALEIASPEERPDAEYIITGKYGVWKNVVQGKQEPLRALMTRKLKLIKGKQLKLLKEVKLALKLISNCTRVDAEYPDEKT